MMVWGTAAIMAATDKSKTCVWRWQERLVADGDDGLLRDKTRSPGIAPLKVTLIARIVALTLEPPKPVEELYLFVGIGRTSKFAITQLVNKADRQIT